MQLISNAFITLRSNPVQSSPHNPINSLAKSPTPPHPPLPPPYPTPNPRTPFPPQPPINKPIPHPLLPPLNRQQCPQLRNPHPLHRQHGVLHAIQILPMDRRDELPRDEAEEDARGEVVFS